jgi:hypothetical protein
MRSLERGDGGRPRAVSDRVIQGISLFRETDSAKMEVVNGEQEEKGR